MKQLIALHGKANSGKGVVIERTDSNYYKKLNTMNTCIKSFNFADPIKRIAQEMFPKIKGSWLWGPSELRQNIIENTFDNNKNPLTVRQLLLDIGKNGRAYNENIWIDATIPLAMKFIQDEYCYDKYKKISIIGDCRHENEFKALKENKFFIVKVVRKNNTTVIDDLSETGLDHLKDNEFDYTLENDGNDLEKFYKNIDKLFEILT